MSDHRTAIEVLQALDEVYDLAALVYHVRNSEDQGWNGPRAIKCGKAIGRARELLKEDKLNGRRSPEKA